MRIAAQLFVAVKLSSELYMLHLTWLVYLIAWTAFLCQFLLFLEVACLPYYIPMKVLVQHRLADANIKKLLRVMVWHIID